MINLGRYSAKNAPNICYTPTRVDRILEAVVLFIVLSMWAVVCSLASSGYRLSDMLPGAITCTVMAIVLAATAYAPIRFINFPVRINERNAAVQYVLAVRLCRILNICCTLLTGSVAFIGLYPPMQVAALVALIGLAIAMIGYFVLAYRNK